RHRHLAIGLLAELTAILVLHPDRMLALLGERGVVDDPRLDRPALFHGRQHHLAHLGQHVFVRPGRVADKMQQRLVLRRRPRRSRPRCHRLDALALAGKHQTGAIIAQRPRSIRVTNHPRKLLHKCRKSCAIPAAIEIHLALPRRRNLNLFNYLILVPYRPRPFDSVQLIRDSRHWRRLNVLPCRAPSERSTARHQSLNARALHKAWTDRAAFPSTQGPPKREDVAARLQLISPWYGRHADGVASPPTPLTLPST